jgi:hypothetical protein
MIIQFTPSQEMVLMHRTDGGESQVVVHTDADGTSWVEVPPTAGLVIECLPLPDAHT